MIVSVMKPASETFHTATKSQAFNWERQESPGRVTRAGRYSHHPKPDGFWGSIPLRVGSLRCFRI